MKAAIAAAWLALAAGLGAQGTAPAGELGSVTIAAAASAAPGQNYLYVNEGLLIARGSTLADLVAAAYGVRDDAVLGGPAWTSTDRFNINAKLGPPADTGPLALNQTALNQVAPSYRPLLQAILADRFGLVVHREDRPLPVFVLTVTGKGKLAPAVPGHDPGCTAVPSADPAQNADGAPVIRPMRVDCYGLTLAALAGQLPQLAPAYVDRPVVDQTALSGAYDFTLSWTARGLLRKPGDPLYDPAANITLSESLARVGLGIEPRTAPLSAVVIDRAKEVPVGLVPALPSPKEFEVASVKPSGPDSQKLPDHIDKGGEVSLRYYTPRDLIMMAYGIREDRLLGAPAWLDSDHFDVVAKIGDAAAYTLNYDSIEEPLQRLLADHFNLALHDAVQPITVYALTVAGRARLTPSAASDRPGCRIGAGSGTRVMTCQATSMAALAEALPGMAPAYFDHPVIDATGLRGTYDFSISYAIRQRVLQDNAAPTPDGAASDPNADLTAFQAVERQLGLKLITEKHPMPVKVIDHIDRAPNNN